jgi:hypothetical protein
MEETRKPRIPRNKIPEHMVLALALESARRGIPVGRLRHLIVEEKLIELGYSLDGIEADQ